MNKTGIYYWFGYPIENKERFRLIKEVGFNNVLLWWGDEFAEYDGDKNHLPEMARSFGLEVENVHAPFDKTNENIKKLRVYTILSIINIALMSFALLFNFYVLLSIVAFIAIILRMFMMILINRLKKCFIGNQFE